jgi:opacity protein-like surface antigen
MTVVALHPKQAPSLATKIEESPMMYVYKLFILLCFLFFASWGYSQSYQTYQKSELLRQAAERKKAINALSVRLDALRVKISQANQSLGEPNFRQTDPVHVSASGFEPERSLSLSTPKEPAITELQAEPLGHPTHSTSREAPVVTSGGGLGVYLVPSIALVHSSGFDWTSVVGKTYEIDEKSGYAAGLRVGRTWDPFFADFQLTYARSDLESNAFSAIPMSFSGDSEFFGFHFTGGGKVGLADRLKLPFGIGVGGGRQEISMALGGVPYSEDDFVLTYHLFAGLEYQPTDHLLFGFRYRLVNLGELPSFSSRNLQLFELSCGYQY